MFSKIYRRLIDYKNPNSLGSRFRRRRAENIRAIIDSIYKEKGRCEILDVGGTFNYWINVDYNFLRSRNSHITLINLEYYQDHKNSEFRNIFDSKTANFLEYEKFDPKLYDLIHSNSVIEHVGDRDSVEKFAELVRRYGQRYFIQTPNFWFPIEGHFGLPFVQFLPDRWMAWLLTRTQCGHVDRCQTMQEALTIVRGIRLLTGREMRKLFPDATIKREWFGLFVKSFMAIR